MAAPEDHFARFRREADAGALAAVFDAVAPELLLVASHLATARTAAEDLVQATFLDAIEKADRWDATRPLLPWLIGILVNHARLERRRQRRPIDASRLPQPGEPAPLDALAASEVAEQVAMALRSLPLRFRQALTLRLVHGLSPTEIAHALGCPVATVKTRLQRGMDWLRKLLPAGIASGLAGMVTAGRGLAAVRAVVLAHGSAPVPATAQATEVSIGGALAGVLGGGVLMKKLVFAACVALCIGSLWFVAPRPDEPVPAGPGRPDGAAPQVATLATTADGVAPDERVAASRAAVGTNGAAALEFVWQELGTPAAGLAIVCDPTWDALGGRISRQTDGAGRLHLADLHAGTYRLFGFFPGMHELTIRAGEVTTQRIEVAPVLRVEGTVVDADGRGVPGAAVSVQYFADSADLEPRPVAVARADGTFVGATDRGGWFWAQKPGFVPSGCRHELVEGRLHLRLVLGAGAAELRGTVRGSDHRPVADARVTIVRTTPRDHCSTPIVLRTDPVGAFTTSELGAGDHLLVAMAPGHAPTPVEFTATTGATLSLDVQLRRGATVHGSVTGTGGRPLRAQVSASPAWAGASEAWVEALRPIHLLCALRTAVGSDGSYRLEHVPGSTVALATSAAGGLDQRKELQLQDGGEQRCDFELAEGDRIRGRVVDADDRPLVNWSVHVSPVGDGTGTAVTTDAEGRFDASGLDGAEYDLTAMPPAARSHVPWVRVTKVRPAADAVVLRTRHGVEDAGWFTGTLLDADGTAPSGSFSVWLTPAGTVQGSAGEVTMRADGRFELGPLPPGTYQVLARIREQGNVRLGTHDLPPRGRIDVGCARLPSPGTLELRFTTADGRTVTASELAAWDEAGNGGAVFEDTADGVVRSRPVPAGAYRVRAWGEGFAPLEQTVVVAAGGTTRTELQVVAATPVHIALAVARAGQVQLQILGDAGQVLASPLLTVDPALGCTWSRGLPAGGYSFEAKAWPDGVPVRGTFVVRGGPTAQRVDVQVPSQGG